MGVPGNANALLLRSAAAAGGYQVSRSLRFNSSDSASLSRASYAGSGTFSCWVKRCKLGTAQTIISGVAFNASDQLNSSTAVFRDPSAWMHVLVSTSGTYVNGTSVASGSAITPGIIGSGCDLYLADIHFIDGQALDPTSFTEVSATTGQLIPKAYTGSYGTNGFQLKFADNSNNTATTLGKDTSGNGNNWTPTNFSVTAGAGNDSLVDTPTSYGTDTGAGGEVRGNYCTWNPLDKDSTLTLANGNLDSGYSGSGSWALARGTIGVSSGKWYWEITAGTASHFLGIANGAHATNIYVGGSSLGYGYWGTNGQKAANATAGQSYGATYTTGDVIGVAFDADNWTLTFYKNGVSQGTAFTSITSSTYFPAISTNTSNTASANFGQRPFAYTAPSGFKALCDTNLPSPLIAKPSTVMDVKLYTGNGSTLTVSGLNFSPDLVWLKMRSDVADHQLYDTVRGTTKKLQSNTTAAEATTSGVTAFNSDGFTLGSDGGSNGNNYTHVAWTWDAGSSTVTNTQGSITSSVRANASAGFSIVTYTGTGANGTIGHGLNAPPSLILTKMRSSGIANWNCYHSSLGANSLININTTGAVQSPVPNYWNNTSPTSTVFSVGSDSYGPNANGITQVAYCWAPVAGYSSFGSYTGNGSSDGPFVYTGFRVKWWLVKLTSGSGQHWYLFDGVRNPYNVADLYLAPSTSSQEGGPYSSIDFCSNGFKIRNNDVGWNQSGATYIYAAFAESPFQFSRAR